ncbi:MAG TPA: fatty acid desaturase [Acidimicrobiales bacterium]|nr:fatty acid desaturase [Acidimicrobiales bacterium]
MPRLLAAVLGGLFLAQVANLITTVYLHRALSHRAMTLSPWLSWVFRVTTWVMTGIRPRQWVAVHRKHHAFTDVPGDPHSPVIEGFAAVQFNNVGLYRRAARDPQIVARYARDLPADRWDKALFDHALLGLGIGVALLFVLFGWEVTLVVAVVHTVTYLALSAAVNAIGHTFGRRPYDNLARNNQWLAWLTAGEGLHNNHHAAPTSARLAHARGEIDPGWWFIRLLAARGWASVRHSQARVKAAA